MESKDFISLTETFDFKDLMGEYYKKYEKYHKSEPEYMCLLNELHKMATEDNIEKWFLYKTLDALLEKRIRRFDCDNWNGTCELTDQIYKTLWINKKEGEFIKFGGDTINSFAYTFNTCMDEKSFRKSYEKYERDECQKEKAKKAGLNEFARNAGCLGNFTLVPSGFNRFRSKLGDYFDLSLKELKDSPEKNWLGEKDNFSQYVNIFFLWGYTNVDKVKRDYTVKPFFDGHSEKHIFPEGDNEIRECVSTMNKNILERGKFMLDMLRIAEKDKKEYERIQEDLFKKDVFFESIGDAREKLGLANKS